MRELITRENKETLDEVNRLDRTLNTEKARHEEEAALVLGEKQQDITVLHHEISIVKLEIDKYLVELDGEFGFFLPESKLRHRTSLLSS